MKDAPLEFSDEEDLSVDESEEPSYPPSSHNLISNLEHCGALHISETGPLWRAMEREVLKRLFPLLEASDISLRDIEEPLGKEKSTTVRLAVYDAMDQIDLEEAEQTIWAAHTLHTLRITCQWTHHPSRREAMVAAKDFYEEEYASKQAEIDKVIEEGKAFEGVSNTEAGVPYQRVVEGFSRIAENWRELPQHLQHSAGKDGASKAILSSLERALGDYWILIDNVAKGLGQGEEVVKWVRQSLQNIIRTQRDLVKGCKPEMLEAIKPLGEEDKVTEWFAKTDAKLEAALRVAGA